MAEFGARVVFLTKGPRNQKQWGTGIRMGLLVRSTAVYEGTPEGVVRAWSIRRTRRPDPGREGVGVYIRIEGECAHDEVPPAPPQGL